MKGTMLIYRPGSQSGERREFDHPPELEELQAALDGGYLESVPYFQSIDVDGTRHTCWALCDEEGKLKHLDINLHATMLWEQSLRRLGTHVDDVLVGPVAVLFGDDEFMEAL